MDDIKSLEERVNRRLDDVESGSRARSVELRKELQDKDARDAKRFADLDRRTGYRQILAGALAAAASSALPRLAEFCAAHPTEFGGAAGALGLAVAAWLKFKPAAPPAGGGS